MPDSHRAFVLEFLKFSIVPAKELTGRNSEAADSDQANEDRWEKYRLFAAEALPADHGKIVWRVNDFKLTIVNCCESLQYALRGRISSKNVLSMI